MRKKRVGAELVRALSTLTTSMKKFRMGPIPVERLSPLHKIVERQSLMNPRIQGAGITDALPVDCESAGYRLFPYVKSMASSLRSIGWVGKEAVFTATAASISLPGSPISYRKHEPDGL